jgi:hypothetical protein
MKEIHTVKMMRIIGCTRRTFKGLFGKPKNLLPLEVQNTILKGRSGCVICDNIH